MKYVLFILSLQMGLAANALAECSLPLKAAQAVARVFVLDNVQEMNNWVNMQDPSEYGKQLVSDYSFSDEGQGAGYSFPMVDYQNGDVDQYVEAWLHVRCDGTAHIQYQLID